MIDAVGSAAVGDAVSAAASGATAAAQDPSPPPISLARGHATPEELAALVAVLSAFGGGEQPKPDRPRSQWTSRERAVRRPLAPGPGAWRASALPR